MTGLSGEVLPGIGGVVFDLDDTLLASGPVWVECWREHCERAGRPWSPEVASRCVGSGQWSEHLADWCGGDAAQLEASCTDYMVVALAEGRVEPLDGALELIATAADRVPVALASAAPRRFVDAAVAAFELGRFLQAIAYADEVTHGKPAPDIYLRAARRLQLPPGRCVAVEDSGSGILAAYRAGLQVLAVPNRAHPPAPEALQLAAHRADTGSVAVKILIDLLDRTAEPGGLT